MALLFIEGFDHYTNYAQKWTSFQAGAQFGAVSYGSGQSRWSSGQGISIASGNGGGSYLYKTLPVNRATLVLGLAWRNQGMGTDGFSRTICGLMDAGTTQIDVRTNEAMQLYLTRNGTVIGSPSTQSVSALSWRYVELKVTFHSSTGTAELRLDGVTVVTFSGNTSASGNAYGNRFYLGGVMGGGGGGRNLTEWFDDLYVLEADSASGAIDFLGDVRVQTLMPSAAGTTTGLTKTGAAATNWQSVNEIPPDTTTSVSGNVAGLYDTYQYPDLVAATNAVRGVAQSFVWQKDDAGFRTATARVRSGSSEADFASPVTPVTSSYLILQQIQETNPVTGIAWAVSEVNAAEFGPKIAS